MVMKKLFVSCKRATYLISLNEEGKLSFMQTWQLRAHLAICSMCNLFKKQTAFFAKNAFHLHENMPSSLSNESKEKMSKAIEVIISEG